MAAATVDPGDGIHQIAARAATTVQQVILPKWTRRVSLAVRSGGSDVEVAWTGVLDAASFATATLWVLCPAGSALNDLVVPQSKFQSGDVISIWIRDVTATATTIDLVCSDRTVS